MNSISPNLNIMIKASEKASNLYLATDPDDRTNGKGKFLMEEAGIKCIVSRFFENENLDILKECNEGQGRSTIQESEQGTIDFAYNIHSQIGDKCVGAKINEKLQPLKTILKNGDQVEIITSDQSQPSPLWERFVVTSKVKSQLRRFFRSKKRDEYICLRGCSRIIWFKKKA